MERIRSFIAVELPPEVRAELGTLEKSLRAGKHAFVKWVDPDGIHLTLKFLGGVAPDVIPGIVKAMTGVIQPVSPFELRMGGLGVFPNWNRPQVVWVGLEGDLDRLAALQQGLEQALSPLGFTPESRAFKAHLTLGRLRERASPVDRQEFAAWARTVEFKGGLSFDIESVNLMKSQLTPGGAIYTPLACVKLGET